jgi:hypothetical protein
VSRPGQHVLIFSETFFFPGLLLLAVVLMRMLFVCADASVGAVVTVSGACAMGPTVPAGGVCRMKSLGKF